MKNRFLGMLAVAGCITGCQDNDLGSARRGPNRPPETVLTGGPTGSELGTTYQAHFYWVGYDRDGSIDHFDYILVDHPASGDSLHAVDSSSAGRFAGLVPSVDDPRWIAITGNDSVFVTRADSFPRPRHPRPGESNEFVRRQSFERWHTFFVRAVDNMGGVDPTPDYRSFNSKTLAPTLSLLPPVSLAHEFQAPPTIVFTWEGRDQIDGETSQPPIASRWVLINSRRNQFGQYAGWPDSLYTLSESRWSPWRAWGASDRSGQRAIVHDLAGADASQPGSGFYLFAVQAMDEAGAVTPVFDDATPERNNAVRVFVSGTVGPSLVVTDRYLGTYTFLGRSNSVAIDVAAGQPIQFHWRADGSSYGSGIAAYRYGWDVRSPDEDGSWEQGWSAAADAAPERAFGAGVHRFWIQVRDDAGTVTSVVFELSVRNVTRGRDLLFVDDSTQPQGEFEALEDARWLAVLDSLARRGGLRFDPGRDIYDVSAADHRNQPPPLSLVFDYDTVIWSVVNATRGSALREVATFFDPYVERNRNRVARFNYLTLYVENGGHFWLCGAQPAQVLWPVGDRPIALQLPVNVVHWDDYATPHPGIDSVGVLSFLYKLGVDGFDLGSGGRAAVPRNDALEQGCQGFALAPNVQIPGAPPVLLPDARWPQPPDVRLNPAHSRPNVEIYDMPRWMARQSPPLAPPTDLVLTPYLFMSGVPEASGPNEFYPQTADRQPAVVLRKSSAQQADYTRAISGFEPWLLQFQSHLGLADFIVLRSMGRDRTP